MIRKTIFLACFLFAVNFSFAQQFSFGVRGGYTLSDFIIKEPNTVVEGTEDLEFDEDFRTTGGLHFGLEGRWEFNQRWAITASPQYNQKGYEAPLFTPTGTAKAKYVLHYLNIPIVGDFSIWKDFSIQAGIETGKLLDTRIKTGGEEKSIKDLGLFSDFDFGVLAGLEYRLENFFIGTRYTWGILNLYGKNKITDQDGSPIDVSSYNRALQFSVGYRYALGE